MSEHGGHSAAAAVRIAPSTQLHTTPSQDPHEPLSKRRRCPTELLAEAIQHGGVQQLELALSEGLAVNFPIARELGPATPVSIVVYLGRVEMVRLLAERGAELDVSDVSGFAPLFIAAGRGNAEMVRLLRELGANIEATDEHGATPLFVAAFEGHVEVVRALHELGANMEATDKHGATPLNIAAGRGNAEVVKLLAERGAEVDVPDVFGFTPLFIAAQRGHVEVVRALHEVGANIEATDKHGATPLFIAAQRGNVEMVGVLAELGGNLNGSNRLLPGFTAVFAAAQQGQAEVIRTLASLNVDVTAAADSPVQCTPLMMSANFAHFEATKTLLLLGAPVTIADLRDQARFGLEYDTRQLRADLQAWAADELVQHRIFQRTFLFGCSAHGDITLTILEGEEALRAKVAEFVGVVVGDELRRTRAVGPAIAAIDWEEHDEVEWDSASSDSEDDTPLSALVANAE